MPSLSLYMLILYSISAALREARLQCLDVCGQAGQSEQNVVLHLENLLEVAGERLELLPQSPVCGHAHAVLASHRDERASVVARWIVGH